MKRILALAAIFFALTSLSTAEATQGSFDADYKTFQNNIESCSSQYGCKTTDSMDIEVSNSQVHLDTGNSGYCGTAGYYATDDIPEDSDIQKISFKAKAYQSYWSASPEPKVMINGDEIVKFTSNQNEPKSYDWETYTADVSQYRGEKLNLSIVAGDENQKYCNMFDHQESITVKDLKVLHGKPVKELNLEVGPDRISYGDTLTENLTDQNGNLVKGKIKTKIKINGEVKEENTVNSISSRNKFEEENTDYNLENGDSITYVAEYTNFEGETLRDSETITFVSEKEQEDSIDLADSQQLFSDAKVVLPDNDGRKKEIGENLADRLGHDADSPEEMTDEEKAEQNLIIIGSPAINSLSFELLQSGKLHNYGGPKTEEPTLRLIKDAYSKGSHVVVLSGHTAEDLESATSYFHGLMRESSNEEAEGKKTITVGTHEKSGKDLRPTKITIKEENSDYQISTRVENTGVENEDVEIKFIPSNDVDNEERGNTGGNSKYEYVLEPGVNWINRTLDPNFIPQKTKLAIDEGEKVETDGNTYKAVQVTGNETVLSINGNQRLADEGDTLRAGDHLIKVEEALETTEKGIVVLRYGSRLKKGQEIEVGIEVDPQNRVEETNENNNRITKTLYEGDKQETGTSLRLKSGWNMISAPESSAKVALNDVTDDCSIQEFQREKSWIYNGEWNHPSSISNTEAVFVKAEKSCEAEIERKETGKTENERRLIAGPSGFTMMSVPRKMSLNQVNGCDFQEYQGSPAWNYRGGEWNRLDYNQELNPKQGYYVKIENSCTANFENKEEPPKPGETQ